MLQGVLGAQDVESPEDASVAKVRALRKCASLQAEFLRVVGELREVGRRLLPDKQAASS